MIYLASPYSHPQEDVERDRYRLTSLATMHLISVGMNVYSPICYSHPLIETDRQLGSSRDASAIRQFEFWRSYDLHMLSLSSRVLVLQLPGWDTSRGVSAEMQFALLRGIPVAMMHYAQVLELRENDPLFSEP